ncbi:MAG: nuclear transport factor 2 family protein [Verrucomicrobiaceae bacterium]|nr:nuclear transport factor 2 family protein [Verrucomicrobiaceae bacterium]
MKTLISSLIFIFCIQAHAEDNALLAAVKAADESRVVAMQSADRDKLTAIFSDELRYAHSTGVVDTKTSFIDVITSGKTKYVGYDYEEQNFTFPAPGIALMSGRAHVKAETATGTMDSVLSFLAVWREEKGQWRFLAWQSCKLPPATK